MIHLNIHDFNLKDIFTCGQSFRWTQVGEQDWIGIAGGRVLRIAQNGESVNFQCSQKDFDDFWHVYFDLDRDYGQIKHLLLESSPELRQALDYGSGIRLLNQESSEMLITFILSANNHIPRITDLVKKISVAYGVRVPHQWEALTGPLYAFPTPEALAEVSVEALRNLGTGYRDKYLHESAVRVAADPEAFQKIGNLPYPEAKKELMTYMGVGAKVADCILLFSSGKHEAFPVDTWIKKTLARRYGLAENQPKAIQQFIEETFGDYRGFAQQYLFYYERSLS